MVRTYRVRNQPEQRKDSEGKRSTTTAGQAPSKTKTRTGPLKEDHQRRMKEHYGPKHGSREDVVQGTTQGEAVHLTLEGHLGLPGSGPKFATVT